MHFAFHNPRGSLRVATQPLIRKTATKLRDRSPFRGRRPSSHLSPHSHHGKPSDLRSERYATRNITSQMFLIASAARRFQFWILVTQQPVVVAARRQNVSIQQANRFLATPRRFVNVPKNQGSSTARGRFSLEVFLRFDSMTSHGSNPVVVQGRRGVYAAN